MQLSTKVKLTLARLAARRASKLLTSGKEKNHNSFPLICNVSVSKAEHC